MTGERSGLIMATLWAIFSIAAILSILSMVAVGILNASPWRLFIVYIVCMVVGYILYKKEVADS